jgi:hypothetical protein
MPSARASSSQNLNEVLGAVKKALSGSKRGQPPTEGGNRRSVPYSAERRLHKTRSVLVLGFGVLLTLLVLCGLNALHVISELQTNDQSILRDFLQQQDSLDKIRSAIYLSGTYLRDYLLEPEPEKAERNRTALESARAQVASMLANPQALSGMAGNDNMYEALKREIEDYWQTLDPVLSWKAEQRHRQGYRFLHDEVLPRRSSTLGIAIQSHR